jgi:hypothetical protein
MKLSHEPIAYFTFVIVVATVVRDVLSHNVDIGTAVNAIIVATAGVIGRQSVVPLSKLTGEKDADSQ